MPRATDGHGVLTAGDVVSRPLTAAQLKLEKVGEGVLGTGSTGEAVWKVKLWAAKLRQPQNDADIGEVWVSASDGKVVKNDLHINSVD